MSIRLTRILLCCVLLALLGCDLRGSGPGPIPANVRGQIVGNQYINDAYGMTLTIPDGWHITKQADIDAMAQLGSDAIVQDKATQQAIRDSLKHSPIVLAFSKHELNRPGVFNPNINVLLEDVSAFPQIKTGEDYLSTGRTNFAGETSMQFADAGQSRDIGGLEFAGHTQIISMMGFTVRGRQYARKFDGLVMVITLSADNPADLAELEAVLDGVTFSN